MKIKDVVLSEGLTGFYFDDQQAIKKGAKQDGFVYVGSPKTDKFTQIRQKGESVSIMLILEDGQVALGDAAAVQYSGAGGRDPLFLAKDAIKLINEKLKTLLIGRNVDTFKENAEFFDSLFIDGKRLHSALRYGITMALLDASAKANHLTISEIVRKEYKIPTKDYQKIPLFAQSGDDRHTNVDKMILKEVDVMPHALINNIDTKLGHNGEILLDYIKWLRNRVLTLRKNPDYNPIFHIDVYGTIGIIFNNDLDRMVDYLITLEKEASPFKIRIEGPIDGGNKEDTMQYLQKIRIKLEEKNSELEIVADEWCNTLEDVKYFADNKAGHMLQVKTPDLGGVNNIIEALLYCKEKNIGAYSGGTCNETDVSSKITTAIAIACEATQCLAKPGMGSDEGIMIVNNEMNRIIALAKRRDLS